ncbi:MAG: hypothetical protein GY749_22755 [Desulfobacteraceae bacterium]|nr:hypothetical protein [Desulfobacteraceae bacterium]
MAVATISDIITPEIYLGYRAEQAPELNMFLKSGIYTAPPPEVISQLNAGGDTINMPYWDYIARSAPQIPSDASGTSITPKKVTAAKARSRKQYWVEAWSSMDLAGIMATGNRKDPEGHLLKSLSNWWIGAEQTMLIASCIGLFADNLANDSGDMTYSVYSDIASPLAANKFSRSAFDRACATLGDRMGEVVAIAMHSSVYLSLHDNDDIDFVHDSKLEKDIPHYKGRLVIVDDQMPVTAGSNSSKYTSYLFGRGAFAYAKASLDANYVIETDRQALTGNGGGQTTTVVREQCLLHPMGADWLEGSVADISPTEAELKLAANWDRKYVRKNIKIASLETNAA